MLSMQSLCLIHKAGTLQSVFGQSFQSVVHRMMYAAFIFACLEEDPCFSSFCKWWYTSELFHEVLSTKFSSFGDSYNGAHFLAIVLVKRLAKLVFADVDHA